MQSLSKFISISGPILEGNKSALITLACEVLKVKYVVADSRVVCYAKSKNHTHFAQSGQVFEIRGCKRIVINALKCYLLSLILDKVLHKKQAFYLTNSRK